MASNRSSSNHGRQMRSSSALRSSRRDSRDVPTGAELEELVQTTALVPVEAVKTDTRVKMETVTPATTAPSSAAPSPLIGVIDADAESWPSLREAVTGWQFCNLSEGEEPEDFDMWEALPEPAIDINSDEEFLNVSNKDVPDTAAKSPGEVPTTLAEMLRKQLDVGGAGFQPPVFGTRRPSLAADVNSTHLFKKTIVNDDEHECNQCELLNDFRKSGWSKDHKSSWNKQYQRKVVEKSYLRAQQSARSRGAADEESNDESDA